MKTYAIDFESYYDSRLSISSHGVSGYLRETNIYLVSIVAEGEEWVGDPRGFAWSTIAGHQWVSHNVSFDLRAYLTLGLVAQGMPSAWSCTADLSVFVGLPRNLAGAAKYGLGVDVDKDPRTKAKGKKWPDDFTDEEQREMKKYALEDSRLCLALWEKFNAFWPEEERTISTHTTAMGLRGLPIGHAEIEQAEHALGEANAQALNALPWYGTEDDKGKQVKPMSPLAFGRQCVAQGLPVPSSTAATSKEFSNWLAEYGELAPWARIPGRLRSINRTLKVVQRMRTQTNQAGRLDYTLKYGGGHTLRWSGDSGLNMQNLTTRDIEGVNLRACVKASPDHSLVILDFAQIEARITLYLAEDGEQLKIIEGGVSVYEAHARATMGWTGGVLSDENPKMYKLAKARVLGLGFGCGYIRFKDLAFDMTRGEIDLTLSEAKGVVSDFRRRNYRIVRAWKKLEAEFRKYAGGDFHSPLLAPGRFLRYFQIGGGSRLTASTVIGGRKEDFFGGKLFENRVQAIARDVLRDAVLNLERAGIPILLTVHDEVVFEVRNQDAQAVAQQAKQIMLQVPEWIPGLPIGVSTEISQDYNVK